MIGKIAALIGLSAALTAGTTAVTGVALVDVETTAEHIIIPVPMLLAQAGARFVPDEARYISVPELALYENGIRALTEALEDAPNTELVRVVDDGESVVINKIGSRLEIHVRSTEESVDVQMPLEAVSHLLDAYDGEGFATNRLVSAARKGLDGARIEVRTPEEHIKVRFY